MSPAIKSVFLLVMMAMPLWAQLDESDKKPVPGTLYVQVDQTAEVYVNGTNIKLSKEHTAPVTFQPGDRLVVQISSTHSYRHLALLFVSTDKQTMISFRTIYFKILPDPEATDFTKAQFSGFPNGAISIDRLMSSNELRKTKKKSAFLYKNDSEFFWGDRQKCAVGTLITSDMFSPMSSEP
jgi:hypothetical protein